MLLPGVYAHGDNSAGQCGLGHTDVSSIDDFTLLERNLHRMRLPADDDEPGSPAPATRSGGPPWSESESVWRDIYDSDESGEEEGEEALRAETDWPVQVACGRRHTVVLTASGNVLGCGENASGQLSHAHAGQLWWLTPQFWPLPSGHRAMRVACGGDHTIVITTGGAAFSCGANDRGQLGIGPAAAQAGSGAEARRLTPVPMSGSALVLDAACGDAHTIFLVALAATGLGTEDGEGGGEGDGGREAAPEASESELAAVMAATAAVESGLGEADLESIDRGLRSRLSLARGALLVLVRPLCARVVAGRYYKGQQISTTLNQVPTPATTLAHPPFLQAREGASGACRGGDGRARVLDHAPQRRPAERLVLRQRRAPQRGIPTAEPPRRPREQPRQQQPDQHARRPALARGGGGGARDGGGARRRAHRAPRVAAFPAASVARAGARFHPVAPPVWLREQRARPTRPRQKARLVRPGSLAAPALARLLF